MTFIVSIVSFAHFPFEIFCIQMYCMLNLYSLKMPIDLLTLECQDWGWLDNSEYLAVELFNHRELFIYILGFIALFKSFSKHFKFQFSE